jgi:hypothetical protein
LPWNSTWIGIASYPSSRRRCSRSDLLEGDAAVLGDLVELQQDVRHLGLVGHRLRQAEDVGDPDLRSLLRLKRQRAGRVDRLVRVRDLVVHRLCLRVLRPDQQEVAAEREDEHADDGQRDLDRLREPALHDPAASCRRSAAMVKLTTLVLAVNLELALDELDVVEVRNDADRPSSRATAACEYV